MSVCPDHFDLDAARVVCKELGCGAALMVYNVSSIANRTEMLRLTCQDGETPLAECWRPGWCRRGSDDAAVACSGKTLFMEVGCKRREPCVDHSNVTQMASRTKCA